jgi:hydrogenase-4 component F
VIGELLSLPALVPLVPLVMGAVVALVPSLEAATWLVIAGSTAAFAFACALPWEARAGQLLLVDPLATHMALLTSFVGMTTAWFSRGYIRVEAAAGRLDAPRLRQYHALFLAFLGFMLAALLANNLGVTWVSVEAATLAAVVVVGLPRTEEAVEASWKFFVLCGVGIALALFGTFVLYLAAVPVLGPGLDAMSWSQLATAAPHCHGPLLNLAFVFLLLGYGTKAGLAPLHAWMPDAHAEGPTPVSAVLAGSILNVALVAILRTRSLLAANAEAIPPGPPLMALGLLSLVMASLSLWRRRDAKRFFAFSTIEQSGVAAFAFGLGGAAAVFAGMLHLTLHTLTKAALFQCVGRASQLKGGQKFTDIGGLVAGHRALGLTLAAAIVGIAGLPPFGLFTSEFLIVMETARRIPWLAVVLGFGLVVGAWALSMRLIGLCLGEPTPDRGPAPSMAALLPAWLHIAVVVVLGLAMPAVVTEWFATIAGQIR